VLQAERDSLIDTHHELEKQLVTRDLELHEKEEELFLQLEKVIRLEEDCEKLRNEKDKMVKWKDRLEREKNEAYRQLRLQAESSEITRRNLERARLDAYRQFSEIAAEKETLEKEVCTYIICRKRLTVIYYYILSVFVLRTRGLKKYWRISGGKPTCITPTADRQVKRPSAYLV